MFEDSLLESGGRLKKRNPWATAMSFALEGAAIGMLVLVPLIYTEALPVHVMWSTSEVFSPPTKAPEVPPEPGHARPTQPATSNFVDNALVPPTRIPVHVQQFVDVAPPTIGTGPQGACVGCITSTDPRPVSTIIADAMKPTRVIATFKPPTRPIAVSGGVSEGLLIRRVTPEYPVIAKQSRTQGTVVLAATIGRDGTIQNLQVLSGHPFLVKPALEAVRQWRYRPYLLSGEPVDVETTITVNFSLNN